ncbi:MAG TPA: hypothetical protein VEG32_12270 [Clostridia bacterium]|nr:hypothetical protein [Clostridia bacterium]
MDETVCTTIRQRLSDWKQRLPDDAVVIPTEAFEDTIVGGHHVTLGTYKLDVANGETLVVFQALVHTWSRPTFLSLGAVGRMYAEGLLLKEDGNVEPASDDLMWQFR